MKKKQDTFEEWFIKNEQFLVDAFCEFVRKEKVYDISFGKFCSYIYENLDTPLYKLIKMGEA